MRVVSPKAIAVALVLLVAAAAAAVLWLWNRPVSQPSRASVESLAPPPPMLSDTAAILGMLRDTVWQRRAATAWGLAARSDIPVARRAGLLLEVLEREIVSPTNARVVAGSWPPFTGFLRIQYLLAFETLGPNARDPVRDAHRGSSGEVREWYTLALGATMDAEAAPALRELLAHSGDADVRMTAARYLGRLKDSEAVAALRAALGDTATAVPVTDVVGRRPTRFYPVREQAALALEDLGFKVERRDDTFIVQ
jgi:HEAT repeat protein